MAGVLLIALGTYYLFHRSPPKLPSAADPTDPRENYTGPFQNIRPEVRYTAEERCADCHLDKALAFADHAMGRTLLPINQTKSPPLDAGHHNPFDSLGFRFQTELTAGRMKQTRRGPIQEQSLDVTYRIGSGTHGHSYLSERDGFLFQTPVSWYSQKGVWDLSPGFDETLLNGRPASSDCLFCHANKANPVEGSLNRNMVPVFEGHSIGCQRYSYP